MHNLKPYREAKLTNAMITTMVIGGIIMTIIMMMLFSTPSLALVLTCGIV